MWHWLDSENKPTLSGLSKTQPMNWRLKIFRKKGAHIPNMCRHFPRPCSLDNTGQLLDTTFMLCWLAWVTWGWSELFSSRGLFANSNVFYIKDLSIYGLWNPPDPEIWNLWIWRNKCGPFTACVHELSRWTWHKVKHLANNSVMEWVKILSE